MKYFTEESNTLSLKNINGFKVLKGLLTFQGYEIMNCREIPLEVLAQMALRVYGLAQTAGNRLYMHMQLVSFYRYRNMLVGSMVRVTDHQWEYVRAL